MSLIQNNKQKCICKSLEKTEAQGRNSHKTHQRKCLQLGGLANSK